jgi:aminoglycoside 6'-N-acetyltransferase
MTDELRPTLVGERVTVRPGRPEDVDALRAIRADPSVARWWGNPEPRAEVEAELWGTSDAVLLVIEVAGEVVGGIQYYEERDPMYHHAGIDIYLAARWQDRGLGSEAIRLLARFLFAQRGHHRLVIDPAVANTRAIAAYAKVGFQPVGIMRQYERGADGHWHDGLLMDLLRDEFTPSEVCDFSPRRRKG